MLTAIAVSSFAAMTGCGGTSEPTTTPDVSSTDTSADNIAVFEEKISIADQKYENTTQHNAETINHTLAFH